MSKSQKPVSKQDAGQELDTLRADENAAYTFIDSPETISIKRLKILIDTALDFCAGKYKIEITHNYGLFRNEPILTYKVALYITGDNYEHCVSIVKNFREKFLKALNDAKV